jgi:hypothetical protein
MVGSDELRRQTSEVFSISIMVVWNIEWGCDVRTVLGRSDAGASIHTLVKHLLWYLTCAVCVAT